MVAVNSCLYSLEILYHLYWFYCIKLHKKQSNLLKTIAEEMGLISRMNMGKADLNSSWSSLQWKLNRLDPQHSSHDV